MPSNLFFKFLARLFYPYGSIRQVILGPAKGLRFRVAPGMGISYSWGRDHREAFDFLAQHLTRGQTVYDVGANQGQFSLVFGKLVGESNMVALEPLPANFESLRSNLDLNAMGNVRTLKLAAGSKAERRAFSYASDLLTMGTFSDCAVKLGTEATTTEVESARLDDLVAQGLPIPQVIKIDVEGAAGEVLAGADELLNLHSPSLFIELHLSPMHDREYSAIIALMNKHGYQVQMLDGQPLEASRPEGEYQAWCYPERRLDRIP